MIDSFVKYTEETPSSEMFRTWGAIFMVAAALERKCWVKTFGDKLFPNLYMTLVGPPGGGKTFVTKVIARMIREIPEHHVAPSSVTKASLIDCLKDASRKLIMPQPDVSFDEFNSLTIVANEFGTLLPIYENDFMSVLTDIYDGEPYAEHRRTKDLKVKLPNPQINMLAATTPSYLTGFLPEGAWDQGFLSRTILIYSGEVRKMNPFVLEEKNDALYLDILHDLKIIGEMYGAFEFTPESANAIWQWHKGGNQPAPDHPKLQHYNTRRLAHVLKLCIVLSAARSPERLIELEDYNLALSLLTQAEHFMPDIFTAMRTGGEVGAMNEAYHAAYKLWAKNQAPVAEHVLVNALKGKVPSHAIMKTIEIMLRANWIALQNVAGKPGNFYLPLARDE